MKQRLITIIVILNILFWVLLAGDLLAQHPGNPPAPPPGCDNPVPGIKNPNCPPDKVPLTGLEWLLVSGGVYAIKKLRDRNDTTD